MRQLGKWLMVVWVSMGFAASAVADPTRVSGYEIGLFFSGRTADCVKTKDNSTCDTYFSEDGSVQRYTYADGKLREGKWWVDDEQRLAVQWTGKKKPLLFKIYDTGEGTWQLVKRGKVVSLVVGVQPGNRLPASK